LLSPGSSVDPTISPKGISSMTHSLQVFISQAIQTDYSQRFKIKESKADMHELINSSGIPLPITHLFTCTSNPNASILRFPFDLKIK
jgi:hypothetical protein